MARPPRRRAGAATVAKHLAQYAGGRAFSWLFGAFPPEQNLRTARAVADAWMAANPQLPGESRQAYIARGKAATGGR